MRDPWGGIRLPADDQTIAPVRILDGEGRVVRVVSADEFRRTRSSVGADWQPAPVRRGRDRADANA